MPQPLGQIGALTSSPIPSGQGKERESLSLLSDRRGTHSRDDWPVAWRMSSIVRSIVDRSGRQHRRDDDGGMVWIGPWFTIPRTSGVP